MFEVAFYVKALISDSKMEVRNVAFDMRLHATFRSKVHHPNIEIVSMI